MEAVPLWIWIAFTFALGACIGSFLNVVIYRLPRNLSLASPGSMCPKCNIPIAFYDNVPIFSWLILAGKCRRCKTPISPRYLVIEFLTGSLFVLLFLFYFVYGFRSYFEVGPYAGMAAFVHGGWLVLLLHVVLISCLVAASAIDLELWVIPISICWFLTGAGLVASAVGPWVLPTDAIHHYDLLPNASASTGALAAGGGVGLIISVILLARGIIKPSYLSDDQQAQMEFQGQIDDDKFNHRLEVLREVLFLLPVLICSIGFYYITAEIESVKNFWLNTTQLPVVSGFLGSLFGYFIGCAIVWATRIFGTLAFGKEAMGLGDVHLMGAAGAIVGPILIVVAFFIAPFFGLAWAMYQMFFQKTRQIPYGPFLSLGIFAVMIFHDSIFNYMAQVFH